MLIQRVAMSMNAHCLQGQEQWQRTRWGPKDLLYGLHMRITRRLTVDLQPVGKLTN